MTAPSVPTRTFAEWEAILDAMPTCSLKWRLLDALYSGKLAVKKVEKQPGSAGASR